METLRIVEKPITRIRDHANVISHLARQLESTARALTHVPKRLEDGTSPIEAADLPHIMQLFADQLESIIDLADGIEANAEDIVVG